MATEARLFTVHGRVQGVGLRDSTRREAERLGLAGHAVNLPDGSYDDLTGSGEHGGGNVDLGPRSAAIFRAK